MQFENVFKLCSFTYIKLTCSAISENLVISYQSYSDRILLEILTYFSFIVHILGSDGYQSDSFRKNE